MLRFPSIGRHSRDVMQQVRFQHTFRLLQLFCRLNSKFFRSHLTLTYLA